MKAMAAPRKSEERVRLDELLVSRGLYATRSRARDAVERGAVTVDGSVVAKPGHAVAATSYIRIDDPAARYVSRAALKLIAGLDHFGLDPTGSMALDIGASTGGFTQVLLERGAAHVTAIDVGHGQLDQNLRDDPSVTVIEGLNARDLTAPRPRRQKPGFPRLRCQLHLAHPCAAAGALSRCSRRQGRIPDKTAVRGGPGGDRQGRHPEGPH